MFQNYQDAMALCRHFGMPHLFITFTCNAQWPKILHALLPRQWSEDRLDIVCRVFKMKVDELLHDLTSDSFFGPIVAGKLFHIGIPLICSNLSNYSFINYARTRNLTILLLLWTRCPFKKTLYKTCSWNSFIC